MPAFLSKKTKKVVVEGNGQYLKHLIELRNVVKTFRTEAGDFTALKGIDLMVGGGEFVAVIGKSGSGKSTLVNMITGIDRPTSGQVYVTDTPVHTLSERKMARWRGRNLGIIFQFFQLLPTLTVIENVVLPMDFCNLYSMRERVERAMHLLELVDVAEQAHKRPTAISGGQQQRVAIARALSNDPPIIVADEPTGNLDSRTAEQVFHLFKQLVADGKTVLMVTHDEAQARRVQRTVILADGEVVNEYLARALPTLSQDLMLKVTHQLQTRTYAPGEPIIYQDTEPDNLYIVTRGEVHVSLQHPDGRDIFVRAIGPGQYFGEMALLRGIRRTATVRAAPANQVEAVALDKGTFYELIEESEETREEIQREVTRRERYTDQSTEG